MRPLNLKMSAFGPYAGKVTIPMEDLGTQGLYLIAGDTGAGKTTIFDAICYALFGSASGGIRETSMLRSKYADPGTPTEVELTFEHKGGVYVVKRNPDYERPALRGNGTTKQNANAELHYPDGRIVSKVREVTEAVGELLGINLNQFTQISMLAQGNFQRLLMCETKERSDIFRKLFSTDFYLDLQLELENRRKAIGAQYQNGRRSLTQYIDGIRVNQEDPLSVDVRRAQEGSLTTEETVRLLDLLTEKDQAAIDRAEETISALTKEIQALDQKIGVARQLQETRENLEKAKRSLTEAEPKALAAKEQRDQAAGDLAQKEALLKKATEIDTELPGYEKLEEMLAELKKYKSEIDRLIKEQAEKENKLKEIEQKLQNLKEEESGLKDLSAEIERLKAELEKAQSRGDALAELSASCAVYKKLKGALELAQKAYAEADLALHEKQDIYNKLDQAFRDGQAGILASALQTGQPCPVCGSLTHPQPAMMAVEAPSEEELKEAKAVYEAAAQKASKTAQDSGVAASRLDQQLDSLLKQSAKLLSCSDPDEITALLAKEEKENRASMDDLTEKLRGEQAKADRKAQLEILIPGQEEALAETRSELTRLTGDLGIRLSNQEQLNKQAAERRAGLNYESKAQAQAESAALKQSAKDLQNRYDSAEQSLRETNERMVSLKAQIETAENTLSTATEIDLDGELARQRELQTRQKGLIAIQQTAKSRMDANEEIRTNILKKSEEISEIEKQLQMVTLLSETASGNLKGKERITLETYIQTTYFDRIIRRANVHLFRMTEGKYDLKRMGEASNLKTLSGLELGVVDHTNGSERSVKSLSGGETFLASLSLALGLSEEVQENAGGIQIDTLFVDEGFGSLSPEFLDQAYNALAGLTEGNRLVGIISHVEELKRKIDKQIMVTKDPKGGSRAEIIM